MLSKIRIVLVRTFHPGNIGSVARAMKNMGLSDLHLVSPREFPSEEANKMAAGAEDLLESVTVCDDLSTAIADCTFVAAASARIRGYDLPVIDAQQCAQLALDHGEKNKVAIIFGPERMGLHNRDIELAKYRIQIPANPEYPSLNLASAVQIITYEIFKAQSSANTSKQLQKPPTKELPSSAEIERLIEHSQKVLSEIGFLKTHQGETMQRIRNILSRCQPNAQEVNILRGILNSIDKQSQ